MFRKILVTSATLLFSAFLAVAFDASMDQVLAQKKTTANWKKGFSLSPTTSFSARRYGRDLLHAGPQVFGSEEKLGARTAPGRFPRRRTDPREPSSPQRHPGLLGLLHRSLDRGPRSAHARLRAGSLEPDPGIRRDRQPEGNARDGLGLHLPRGRGAGDFCAGGFRTSSTGGLQDSDSRRGAARSNAVPSASGAARGEFEGDRLSTRRLGLSRRLDSV
jgi:hypothetical protein